MPRSSSLLHRYMAGLSYPAIYQQVLVDYKDLEEQRRYLDSLLATERQTLAALEESFRVRPQDTSTLEALLRDVNVNEQRVAAVEAATAGVLSDEVRTTLTDATVDIASFNAALQSLEGQLTPAQLEAALKIGDAAGYSDLRDAFRRAPTISPAALSAGLTAEERALSQARAAFAAREPSGVVGLERGQAEIARRESTTAPAGSSYSTEQHAFEAALTALQDGQIVREEFGSDIDFEIAKEVYDKAAATGGYTNEQRKLFSPTFLDQRKRVAEVERAADEIARPEGMTREQEVIRKQLEQRGYDFSKPYLRMQKSPYYKNLLRADELYKSALEAGAAATAEGMTMFETPQGVVNVVRATNDEQKLARDYVIQMREAGQPLDMKTMQKEFRKAFKKDPAKVDEALSFALAFNRGLQQNLQTPDDAQLQLEALREESRLQTAREDEARRALIAAEDVRREQQASEAAQAQDVLRARQLEAEREAVRESEAAQRVELYNQTYMKLRAQNPDMPLDEVAGQAAEFVESMLPRPELLEVPVPAKAVPPVAQPIVEQVEAMPDVLKIREAARAASVEDLVRQAFGTTGVGQEEASAELQRRFAAAPTPTPTPTPPPTPTPTPAVQPIATAEREEEEEEEFPFVGPPVPTTKPPPALKWNPASGQMEEVSGG